MGMTLRAASAADDAELQRLCSQLGYDAPAAVIPERRDQITNDSQQALFVAADGARLLGFLHVYRRSGLETAPVAQVQAVVVDEGSRRRGVARALLDEAEAWAGQQGLSSVSLYCDTRRDEAHAFYTECGYELAVSASRFTKHLD